MKIKTAQYYETSAGQPVKTLEEWKRAELTQCFPTDLMAAVDHVLKHADDILGILSATERGRPNGAKDKKPRKKIVNVMPVLPTPVA